jgi:hypothetical protein
MSLWPANSCTVLKSTPAITNREMYVCRKMCQVTSCKAGFFLMASSITSSNHARGEIIGSPYRARQTYPPNQSLFFVRYEAYSTVIFAVQANEASGILLHLPIADRLLKDHRERTAIPVDCCLGQVVPRIEISDASCCSSGRRTGQLGWGSLFEEIAKDALVYSKELSAAHQIIGAPNRTHCVRSALRPVLN